MSRMLTALLWILATAALAATPPEVPHVEYVVPCPKQPQEGDAATVWYDDFNGPAKAYTESSGGLDASTSLGGTGQSMQCLYEKGQQGKGNRKVFFGDAPVGKGVRQGEVFTDVYWRLYVKHQHGWTGGGPAKMSRATSITSPKWTQAMIAHVWSSGEALTLDPASGVRDGQVATTQYNDFPNLKWLGNKPASRFLISSQTEAGWWVCVEARAKLNAPGAKDGLNQLWIDGGLEAERKNLDWRGSYTGHGINAVFLEAYWNKGSPVTQSRWYDNFVIATKPIGPVVCPRQPVLVKTPYYGPGELMAWQAEVAADADGEPVVWQSKIISREFRMIRVDRSNGTFLDPLAQQDALAGGTTYWCRVRQQGSNKAVSEWSRWHQAFVTEP